MSTRRRLGGLAFLALAATAVTVADGSTHAQPAPITIQVLGTNDFHGRLTLSPPNGGAAVLAGAVEQLRGAHPDTIFAAAGDLVGASTFESFIQHDKPTIDALNLAGLQVSAVGNHEFDQGYADLTQRIMAPYDPTANPFGGAQWQYLGANVRNKADGSAALPESWTEDLDGVTVGFVGAVTEHLPELVSPAGISTLTITNIVSEANRVADQLKANGADIVVLLVHEGAATTALSSATDPTSDFGKIVNGVDVNVDAIISGHTHLAYNHSIPVPAWVGRPVTNRPVVSAGQYGFALNQLLFEVDPRSMQIESVQQSLLPLLTGSTPNFPADPAVAAIVADAVAKANVLGSVELGTITGAFNRAKRLSSSTSLPEENRGGESTLGNLVAEVQRDQTGAQLAMMNPGGLRADMVGNPSTPPYPTVLTYKQAADVQPFANTLVKTKLTGAQIKTVLEQQWQPAGASRPFLRLGLSKGLTYTYDPNAGNGAHITQIRLNGTALDPTATYDVTVNSFLAAGGDNFLELANGTQRTDTGKIDLQSMVDYMDANSPVGPDYTQRSVGISFPAGAPATYEPGKTVAFALSSLSMPSVVQSPGELHDANVTVTLDGTPVGTFPVDNTVAPDTPFDEAGTANVSFTVPIGTPAGAHTVRIVGDVTGTSITVPLTTAPVTSTAKLTANAPGQVFGSSHTVTLTATVTRADGVTPTGSVDFVAGGSVLATVPLTNGAASYTLPSDTPAGTLTITARYAGVKGEVAPSESAPVMVVVAKAMSTTVLASFGTRLLLSATGLDNGRLPQGYIEYREGAAVIGRVRMIVGLSLFVVPNGLGTGPHTITATFVPFDVANVAGSTSNPVVVVLRR